MGWARYEHAEPPDPKSVNGFTRCAEPPTGRYNRHSPCSLINARAADDAHPGQDVHDSQRGIAGPHGAVVHGGQAANRRAMTGITIAAAIRGASTRLHSVARV